MTATIKNLPLLPAERALKVISGRWKAVLIYHLFDGPKRLSALQRLVPAISQKVLVQQLRELEAHGLVHREIFREVPPRVEYSATRLGVSLKPVFLALCNWGRRHASALGGRDPSAACDAVNMAAPANQTGRQGSRAETRSRAQAANRTRAT